MGASQSNFRSPAVIPSTSYLGELGNEIQYEKSMGSSRFLKAIKARQRQGALVVKVFLKFDPHMDLRPTSKRIAAEKSALADCPNTIAYTEALATERGGYLIRQWVASSLYDRISTRPFLSQIEKKWIVFQLLTALKDCHIRKVCHGDIKSENVLVTSWNWVYLSDFSSAFKPAYLPEDDPADFSYFFDTSGRRTCYLAPERFYTADSHIGRKKAGLEVGRSFGRVTEAMDVFGLGCVIGELFVEGTPPFTLSQLFKYKGGEFSLEPFLNQIEDKSIRDLVKSMTSLLPSDRLSCEQYLADGYGSIFPEAFYDYFYDFIASTNEINVPVPAPVTAISKLSSQVTGTTGSSTPQPPATQSSQISDQPDALPLQSNADEIVNRIWMNFEQMERYFSSRAQKDFSTLEDTPHIKLTWTDTLYPLPAYVPTSSSQDESKVPDRAPTEDGPALLVFSLLCANIRNCARPSSVLRALDLLLAFSPYLTDETKLDRLLPFVESLFQSETAAVRAAALRTLTQVLSSVEVITPANATIFSEYVLPNILPFANDPDEFVRCTYALSIGSLATCGQRYLDMTQVMKADGTLKLTRAHDYAGAPYEMSYDASLLDLQAQIQEQINFLLTDSSPSVRRALVLNITPLCSFLGRAKTSDVFGLMTTHLNDADWLLRASFFQSTVGISTCMSMKSVDEYILPLMTQALADNEEAVVVRELNSLSILAELGYYQKSRLWETLAVVIALIPHPNVWIRSGAANFIASSTKFLSDTDTWCNLYPALRKMLQADIRQIDEISILQASVGPLSRAIYEGAVLWASKSPKALFWKRRGQGVAHISLVKHFKELTTPPQLSNEEKEEMRKLHSFGMNEEDSYKLLAMREHIVNVSQARKSISQVTISEPELVQLASGSEVPLTTLGITPQTIIFSTTDRLAARLPSKLHQTENWPRRWSINEHSRPNSAIDLTRPSGSRTASIASGADALRRRLALANTSPASLHSAAGSSSPRLPPPQKFTIPPSPSSLASTSESASGSPRHQQGIAKPDLTQSSATIKPTAPSEISQSTNLSRQRSKVNMHGVEVTKVSAAISSDMATALGQITTEPKFETESTSGFSTPVLGVVADAKAYRKTENRRFMSTYDGDDPSIRQLLDRVYLDNYREPMPEFGAHIPAKVLRRRPLRPGHNRDRLHRRPEGTLIAHLVEHTASITSIAVSPDHLFFATGSDDGTVKVWDSTRLEKNVTSRSRQSIHQGGRITSVIMLQNSHCLATASDNGSIWVNRVDVQQSAGTLPRYGKQALIRQYTVDSEVNDFATCMVHYDTDSASKLIYATAQSKITILDIRTLRRLQEFQNPKPLGSISCMCIDRKHSWLLVGTQSGYLSLWDLRFGLLLKSWQASRARHRNGAILTCLVHPRKGKGKWVVVAAEGSEGFETWDIESGQVVESFRTIEFPSHGTGREVSNSDPDSGLGGHEVHSKPALDAEGDPGLALKEWLAEKVAVSAPASQEQESSDAESSATALHSFSHKTQGPGIGALLIGSDYSNSQETAVLAVGSLPPLEEAGNSASSPRDLSNSVGQASPSDLSWIISGGEDRKLRFWDSNSAEKSAVVSGLDEGEEKPMYTVTKSNSGEILCSTILEARISPKPSSSNRRNQIITSNQQTLLKAHQDAITSLALLELPFRCIVSGDRSGVIKVWE